MSAGKPTPTYGADPGRSGLTPSQTASLYGASKVYQLGNKGEGQGATLAVFELSAYTPSDITTYVHQFFGDTEQVQLVDFNVDEFTPYAEFCTGAPSPVGRVLQAGSALAARASPARCGRVSSPYGIACTQGATAIPTPAGTPCSGHILPMARTFTASQASIPMASTRRPRNMIWRRVLRLLGHCAVYRFDP